MKPTNKLLAVSLLIAAAMTAMAYAQDKSAQQGAPNPGGIVGHGILAPGMVGLGMMGHDGGSSGMMHSGAFDPAMCAAMTGHIDGRLAYLKAELKITEAQEQL